MSFYHGLRLTRTQLSSLPCQSLSYPSWLSKPTNPTISQHALLQRNSFRVASTSSQRETRTVAPVNTDVKSTSPPPSPQAVLQDLTYPAPSAVEPSSILNPPATTRPPPLELPVRQPDTALFSHLFQTGKAYMSFYKAGIKAIFTNRRLLQSPTYTPPPGVTGATTFPSRAAILLRDRTRHDLSRIPLFGLMVLICGEFTPLIVLVFPRVTPYTCRIPKQIARMRRSAETRRAASLRQLAHVLGEGEHPAMATVLPPALEKLATGHISRSLGLTSGIWDKAGLTSPLAATAVQKKLQAVVADDARIREGGGVEDLVDEEVVLACDERGIDVISQDIQDLRSRLSAWVNGTTTEGSDKDTEAMARAKRMLLGLPPTTKG